MPSSITGLILLLKNIAKMYSEATDRARTRAQQVAAEDCPEDCKYKYGYYTLRDIMPPEIKYGHQVLPNGKRLAMVVVTVYVQWVVVVYCLRRESSQPPPATLPEIEWNRASELDEKLIGSVPIPPYEIE